MSQLLELEIFPLSIINSYLKFSDRCKITALVDINLERATAVAEKYNLNVKIYS